MTLAVPATGDRRVRHSNLQSFPVVRTGPRDGSRTHVGGAPPRGTYSRNATGVGDPGSTRRNAGPTRRHG